LEIGKDKLVNMYSKMVEIRKFEETVSKLFAEGLAPGLVHLYIGEEAVAVGACANLRKDDYITSTHRGHGHCIAKGGDMRKMMAEVLGKETGYCKGRGGTMHICDYDIGVVGCSGIVGSGIPIAAGVGLSIKLRKTNQVCACFFGDGASNTGAFHEGINMAALWKLPVIFICENNLYGITVHQSRSTSVKDIASRAAAYNIPGIIVDGMDVIAVHNAVYEAAKRVREGAGPSLIECKTYRFRGHHEGDNWPYRTKEEIQQWEKRCPVKGFRTKLVENKVLTEEEADAIERKCAANIEDVVRYAKESPYPKPEGVLENLFAPSQATVKEKAEGSVKRIGCAQAIRETLREEMLRDERVIVFGEDIAIRGGIFGCTEGLLKEFGEERVRDTPISEAAIIGTAIGSAATGMRPVAEIGFSDFIGCGMDQMFNQLAKMRYMFGGQAKLPVVIRTTTGSRWPFGSGAAQHSQSLEAWFMHVPGLKVVTFSTPYDAKGLLKTALRDGNPVLFFEHKLLYFRQPRLLELYPSLISDVPEEDYTIPLGKADVKREGEDVTIFATMIMVHKALKAAEELSKQGISAQIVDLRTLVPLDKQAIKDSVKKTGRAVVVSEDCKTGGVAAEIASTIIEEAFDYLDAPIKRVSALDVPIPYSPALEEAVQPKEKDIVDAVREIVG